MSDKVTLLIDMDGVLGNWYGNLVERWKQLYPERPFIPAGELKSFYVEDSYPDEDHQKLLEITRSGSFYEDLQPIEGALEALKDMELNCSEFIDPYICTAPDLDFSLLDCHSQKARWTRRHLGDFWLKRMILTKDKTLVRGHILIDDKPTITGAMTPVWHHLLFASSYANRPTSETFSWADWPRFRDGLKKINAGPEIIPVTKKIIVPR